MQELKKNPVFWAVIVITGLNLCFFGFDWLIVDRVATRVIERLQKGYSPSPYGPGVDPDKIDPRSLQKKLYEMQQTLEGDIITRDYDQWRAEWENGRMNPDSRWN